MKLNIYYTEIRSASKYIFTLTVFVFLCAIVNSQNTQKKNPLRTDPVHPISTKINPRRLPSFYSSGLSDSTLKPPFSTSRDRTSLFYDSLKKRASKTLVTEKLYDFLITGQNPVSEKQISASSEAGFRGYAHKRIRNITFSRLGVFGTNVVKPDAYNPNKIEKILNKTHFYTNENIIRKNLLFTSGDSVSPLILSDNERILRQLPFIADARIFVIPVSDNEVDIRVVTRDLYSLGGNLNLSSVNRGSLSVFDKNIFGMGHEFGVEFPWDTHLNDSPGFGVKYLINNIGKSFINLGLYYYVGLGKRTYGFDLTRNLVSSSTRYAGGVSIRQMYTSRKLDSMIFAAPVKYNLQDYWLLRSFLIDPVSVSRLIFGGRYTNNNVFDHPFITSDSYYNLQKYKIFLASVAFSVQKFYRTNLVYGYGRTEDIPYGGMVNVTTGREINEFKVRNYLGGSLSLGESIKSFGYIYGSAGFSAFFNKGKTEQGLFKVKADYISNLLYLGSHRMRNFARVEYTRGFDRYSDEYLSFNHENGFSGFSNDSLSGGQRLTVSLESVLFSPLNLYGFRFAFFAFGDAGFLFGSGENIKNCDFLSGVGIGIRIRNDNLLFNTLQIRLGFYPNLPVNSRTNVLMISGQQLLRPDTFEPGPPSIIPYR